MSAILAPVRDRFDRFQYEHLVETGVFGAGDRCELLDGEIIEMSPQKSRHATAVTLVAEAFRSGLDGNATVRIQLPFALDDHSEPEPDVAVVPGRPRDYRDAHPSHALLICEVADTSLDYDRGVKLAAYASAGIPEYWILDLAGKTLEVCRHPQGRVYTWRRVLSSDDRIRPVANSLIPELTVAELLP
jgi:Uma2 family endonuclease